MSAIRQAESVCRSRPIGETLLHILCPDCPDQAYTGNDSKEFQDCEQNIDNIGRHPVLATQTGSHSAGAPPAILLQIAHHQKFDNSRKRSRILLQGPARSGKTSLAMNLAYSKACSAAPCLCLDAQMCNCTAVTLYKAAPPQHREVSAGVGAKENVFKRDIESFPLWCRCVDAKLESHSQQSCGCDSFDCWDPQILKRIRIQRVSSVRELLEDLLSILEKPMHDQPQPGGAIIIDDLDKVVARDPNIMRQAPGHAHRNATSSAVLQTVAVTADTANALDAHRSSCDPTVVLITAEDHLVALSPSIDTLVTLCQKQYQKPPETFSESWKVSISSADGNIPQLDSKFEQDSVIMHSLWDAKIFSSLYASPEALENRPAFVQYVVAEGNPGGNKELWWRSSSPSTSRKRTKSS